MDKIINILLLTIIFVFDPLAISLVIAANFAFEKAYPKKQENLYGELEDDFSEWDDLDEEDWPEPNDELQHASEEYKKAITDEYIDKMHKTKDAILEKSTLYKAMDKVYPEDIKKYEDIPIKVAGEEEIQTTKDKIHQLQQRLVTGLSGWRTKKIQQEINNLKSKLPKDDGETKTY